MADLSISFTVDNSEEFQSSMDKASTALTDAVTQALEDLRSEIDETTTNLCPVDTGALQRSIDITVEDFSIFCNAGEEYASYVDGGTRYMDAEPFFENPINDAFSDFQQTLEDMIQSSLDDI